MKNRDYKVFAPDHYYHVFNRGVGKMDIFQDEEDYKFFLFRLKEYLFPKTEDAPLVRGASSVSRRGYIRKALPQGAFRLICYCLMPNHFHFLIMQDTELSISKLMSKVCTGYSMYFNKKYERTGTLFQDQYKAVLVDSDAYLLWLSAYIHNNPHAAGFVKNLQDWQWSSYPDYTGLRQGILCDKEIILKISGPSKTYSDFTHQALKKIKEKKDLENLLLD